MPGITLTNTGITLPVLGGDPGVWDDENNACWANYDVHDHSPGKGVKVPVAGLNINADLPMASFGLTSVGRVAFAKVAALTSGANTIFVNTADGELYYRTSGGVNVKLTSGNSLNMSLLGGILGDYAAVGATVAYDDANDVYTFKQQGSPAPWAHIAAGGVQFYEYNTTETVYTQIKVAPALAASYDITLPVALPASTMIVVMDNTGVLSLGSSAAMAANQDITLSGTGTFKHGTKPFNTPIISSTSYVTAGSLTNSPAGGTLGANSTVYVPLPPVPKHWRVVNVRLYYGSNADAAACTAKLFRTSDALPAIGGFTDLTATLTPSASVATYSGINYQPTNAGALWVQVTNTTGGERISAVGFDYDIP